MSDLVDGSAIWKWGPVHTGEGADRPAGPGVLPFPSAFQSFLPPAGCFCWCVCARFRKGTHRFVKRDPLILRWVPCVVCGEA